MRFGFRSRAWSARGCSPTSGGTAKAVPPPSGFLTSPGGSKRFRVLSLNRPPFLSKITSKKTKFRPSLFHFMLLFNFYWDFLKNGGPGEVRTPDLRIRRGNPSETPSIEDLKGNYKNAGQNQFHFLRELSSIFLVFLRQSSSPCYTGATRPENQSELKRGKKMPTS